MANQRLNAVITIGGAVAGSLVNAIGTTKTKLNELGSTVSKLKDRQKELGATIKQQENLGATGSALRVQYAQQEIALLDKQITKLKTVNEQIRRIDSAKQANVAKRAELRGGMFDTIALGATAVAPIVQAAQFEKAMLGVAKQVDGARDSSGKLTAVYYDMAKEIQQLGRVTPLATNEIADMVAAGARMGVAKDQLIDFTKTSAMMAAAFELPAGELAEQMGKIATLFKIPIPAIGELADTINYLDDNAISKGGDIIDVLKRIGGTAQMVKMASKEAAALASTFLTLGSSAEVSATASNAVMRELSIATMQPKRFKAGLEALKMDASKVQKDMAKDATGTILTVLDKLNAIPQEKRLTVATQLFGKEYGDDVSKLAEGIDEYRRQLTLATGNKTFANGIKDADKMKDAIDKAGKAGGSMQREFEAMRASTSAQFQMTKNSATELSVSLGDLLLPQVRKVLRAVNEGTQTVTEFTKTHPVLTTAIVGTTTALIGMRIATFAAGYAWTFVRGTLISTAGILAGTRAQIALTTISTNALGAAGYTAQGGLLGMATTITTRLAPSFAILGAAIMATPIGWIIGGIAAIAVGGALIYKYWEPLRAFFTGFGEGVVSALTPVYETIMKAFSPIVEFLEPIVKPIIEWFSDSISGLVKWFGELLEPISSSSEETKKFGDAGKECGEVVGGAFRKMLAPIEAVANLIILVRKGISAATKSLVDFLGLKDGVKAEEIQYDAMGNPTGVVSTPEPTPATASKTIAPVKPQASALPKMGAAIVTAAAIASPAPAQTVNNFSTQTQATTVSQQPIAFMQSKPQIIQLSPAKAAEAAPSVPVAGIQGKQGEPAKLPAPLPAPQMATARAANTGTTSIKHETTININQLPGQDSKELARQVARELDRQRDVNRRSSMMDGGGTQ